MKSSVVGKSNVDHKSGKRDAYEGGGGSLEAAYVMEDTSDWEMSPLAWSELLSVNLALSTRSRVRSGAARDWWLQSATGPARSGAALASP